MGENAIIVVMGVSGCGKTTVGRALAETLGCGFAEGDDYHPPANVAKMRDGVALSDADRRPWLERMADDVARWDAAGESKVLSCSALKKSYRQILAGGSARLRFLYLKGTEPTIRARLEARRGHYMPASLLRSQFAALEEPDAEEPVLTLDAAESPERIVEQALAAFDAASADRMERRG